MSAFGASSWRFKPHFSYPAQTSRSHLFYRLFFFFFLLSLRLEAADSKCASRRRDQFLGKGDQELRSCAGSWILSKLLRLRRLQQTFVGSVWRRHRVRFLQITSSQIKSFFYFFPPPHAYGAGFSPVGPTTGSRIKTGSVREHWRFVWKLKQDDLINLCVCTCVRVWLPVT